MSQTYGYIDDNGVHQQLTVPWPVVTGGYGVTSAGSSTPVAGPSISLVQGVSIKGHPSNNDLIYVGMDNSVSASNGFPLNPNDVVFVAIDNASKIYTVSASGTQKACFLGS